MIPVVLSGAKVKGERISVSHELRGTKVFVFTDNSVYTVVAPSTSPTHNCRGNGFAGEEGGWILLEMA